MPRPADDSGAGSRPAPRPDSGAPRARPGRAGLGVRASDAEREQALAELREQYAAGRLGTGTFQGRIAAVLRARLRRELAEQLADLPAPQDRAAAAGTARTWAYGRTARRPGRPPEPGARRDELADWLAGAADRAGRALRAVRAAGWLRQPSPRLVLPAGPQSFFTIGREPGCDLRLADAGVSRRHAVLRRSGDGWLLSDLGSLNGTWLNGWRVTEPAPVQPGDRVCLGTVTYVLALRP
ncbi:MAG: FHA domain-containing protein [Streptosporangiaceae bacterium]